MVHILVAEDAPEIVRIVQRLLEPEGYRITAAGAPWEVRAAVAASKPDYVLLNINLEGIGDGLVLLPELAAQGIPVIMFSAYDPFSAIHRFGVPRDLPYIEKPFLCDELLAQVARFCPKEPQTAPDGPAAQLTLGGSSEPLTILLVSDFPEALELLEDYFTERCGYTVQAVSRVPDALRWAHDQQPDVLLMDIPGPQREGPELVSQLRQYYPELPTLPLRGARALPLHCRALFRLLSQSVAPPPRNPYTREPAGR